MVNPKPEWKYRGKTIAQLIEELRSFEDQTLEVRISVDDGGTSVPISLVGKHGDVALLKNCEDEPSVRKHG
jgi:GT2 family glycosyltransferase